MERLIGTLEAEEYIEPWDCRNCRDNKIERIIWFISTFEMYAKEESGIKPNTLRHEKYYEKAKTCSHVGIRKGYTKTFFLRKITDVTKWSPNCSISWNPNEVVQ